MGGGVGRGLFGVHALANAGVGQRFQTTRRLFPVVNGRAAVLLPPSSCLSTHLPPLALAHQVLRVWRSLRGAGRQHAVGGRRRCAGGVSRRHAGVCGALCVAVAHACAAFLVPGVVLTVQHAGIAGVGRRLCMLG